MAIDFQQLVYDGAKESRLTSKQVRVLSYKKMAELAGVDSKKGHYGFYYDSAKKIAADRIAREERAVILEARRALFQATLREIPGYPEQKVFIDKRGQFKIGSAEGRQYEKIPTTRIR